MGIKDYILSTFYILIGISIVLCSPSAHATDNEVRISQSRLIKITDNGLVPNVLNVNTADSIVFFLNNTTDALATMAVEFGEHVTHCASSNMKIDAAGTVNSAKPFGPRDFASTCFHEPGTYAVTVYGLRAYPNGAKGTVVVK